MYKMRNIVNKTVLEIFVEYVHFSFSCYKRTMSITDVYRMLIICEALLYVLTCFIIMTITHSLYVSQKYHFVNPKCTRKVIFETGLFNRRPMQKMGQTVYNLTPSLHMLD